MDFAELMAKIGFTVDQASINKVNQTVGSIKGMIGKALGAIGIGFSLKALNDAVEQVRGINRSLESALGQFGDMDEIQKKILDTSKDVVGNYEDIAKNVSDLVKNNKTLFDVDKATEFTDTMTKLVKLSGGSNAEASGLISSMASDFKHGRVSSGIIEQLINKVPEATKILTQYYGVNEQRLRTMAQAGLLRAKDLQKAFADAGESVNQAFEEMGPRITDVLSSARSEFKYFIEETDEMFGITQNIAKFLRSGFQTLMRWLQDARSKLQALSDKVGGFQNILKTIAAILIAMNFDKIVKGVQSLASAFSTMGAKGMLIVGIIALLLLTLEDLVYFMQGKDSLLGRIFDKAGIDSEKARDMITGAWGGIKDFLAKAWQGIKDWWDENGEGIIEGLKGVVQAITRIVNDAWKTIQRIWASISSWWDENGEAITEKVVGLFGTIKDDLIAAWHAIEEWWNEHGDSVIELIAGAFTGLLDACGPLIDALKDLWELLKALITGDFEGAWESFKKIGEDLVKAFTNLAAALYDTELGKKAMDWGSEFVANFVAGIKGGYDKLKAALRNAANDIRAFFGLDPIEEEKAPLDKDVEKRLYASRRKEYEDHMKEVRSNRSNYYVIGVDEGLTGDELGKYLDYTRNLSSEQVSAYQESFNGYRESGEINDALTRTIYQAASVVNDLAYLGEASSPSAGTLGNSVDSRDMSTEVNQEVTINNTFNGEGQQNSYAAAKKIGNELTRELGRPLQLLHAR